MKIKVLLLLLLAADFILSTNSTNSTNATDDQIRKLSPEQLKKMKEKEEQNERYQQQLRDYRTNFTKLNVTELTDDNYTNFTQSNAFTFVYFHSGQVDTCVKFMDEFKFINDYLNSLPSSNIHKVVAVDLSDSIHNARTQRRFPIQNLPFFIMFSAVYQRYLQYTGYHNAQSIITFVLKASLANVIDINTTDILHQLTNPKYTYASLFVFSDKHSQDISFMSGRQTFILFGNCTNNNTLCNDYFKDIRNNSDLVLMKTFEYDDDFTKTDKDLYKQVFIPYNFTDFASFKLFVSLQVIPTVHNFTDYSAEITFQNQLNSLIFIRPEFLNDSNPDASKIILKTINKYKQNLTLGSILDPARSYSDYDVTKIFGIEPQDFQKKGLVFILKFKGEDYELYRMDTNILINEGMTENNIDQFVNNFTNNKVVRDIKSENIPLRHPKYNLRMVVGKTFKEEIENNYNKSVCLYFLTMNLTNLGDYEKDVEVVADHFAIANQTLTFAFLDPLMNEIPNMPDFIVGSKLFIRYYFKDKSKGFIDFSGNYTNYTTIEDFVLENYKKEIPDEEYKVLREHVMKMVEEKKEEDVKFPRWSNTTLNDTASNVTINNTIDDRKTEDL